jgi:hypothetical protein
LVKLLLSLVIIAGDQFLKRQVSHPEYPINSPTNDNAILERAIQRIRPVIKI